MCRPFGYCGTIPCVMAITFNERAVDASLSASTHTPAPAHRSPGERHQGAARPLDTRPGGRGQLGLASRDLAWFQLLEGEANLSSAAGSQTLTADHVPSCRPGSGARWPCATTQRYFYAGVPDAARFDRGSPPNATVRDNGLDARARARLRARRAKAHLRVTPGLFGTKRSRAR